MRFCLQGVENQSRKKHRNVCVKTRTCFSEKSYMFLDIFYYLCLLKVYYQFKM